MRIPASRSLSCNSIRTRAKSSCSVNEADVDQVVGKGQKRAESNRRYQAEYRNRGFEARQKLPELYARIAELERENSRLKDLLWKQRDPEGWEMAQKDQVGSTDNENYNYNEYQPANNQPQFNVSNGHQQNRNLLRPDPIQRKPSADGIVHSASCQNLNGYSPNGGQIWAETEENGWAQSWDSNSNFRERSCSMHSLAESIQSFASALEVPQWPNGGLNPPMLMRTASYTEVSQTFPEMTINDGIIGLRPFERQQSQPVQPLQQQQQDMDGFFAPPFAMDIMNDPNGPVPMFYGQSQNGASAAPPLTTIIEDTPRLYDLDTPMFN